MTTIFLTGCMGAGKSSVGRLVAGSLGRAFVDLDDEIAAGEGMTAGEIIESRGEAVFREIESRRLRRVAAPDGRIVALGGGTLEREENRAIVAQAGKVVYLRASAEALVARLSPQAIASRPLLHGNPVERMAEILDRRNATYAAADLVIDTTALAVKEVAAQVCQSGIADGADHALSPLGEVAVSLDRGSYPIYLTSGARFRLGELMARHLPPSQAALIVDGGVAGRYAAEAERALSTAGFRVHSLVVPAGEATKSMAGLSKVYDFLLDKGWERGHPVVALGGGVVGDLAGLAAATTLRGVPLVQVPTTLLAQVDSSVGGKTAINHSAGKNLVGAFYQPRLVFIDVSYLRTLPDRGLRSGLAEVVKYGVISDADLFAQLEEDADRLVAGDEEALLPAIRRSCEIKAEVVAADEKETRGVRANLNFGHTLGHALEALAGYGALTHGEAVAVGMVLAARLSHRLGLCDASLVERLVSLLRRIGLPTTYPFVPQALVDAASTDKKMRSGALHFVLAEEIGTVRQVPISPDDLLQYLRGLS